MSRASVPRRVLVAAAVFLVMAGFLAGAATERVGLLPGSIVREPVSVERAFTPFWQAWDLVQAYYVDRAAVQATPLAYGATEGMLAALGDTGHTRFLTPQAYHQEEQALSGQIQGIGAEIGLKHGQPTIVAPFPGSPAVRAGIRAGDVIVAVNGKTVAGLDLTAIVQQVRGPAGTDVTLTVRHAGADQSVTLTVQRAEVHVPNVSWAKLPGTDVALVHLMQLAQGATNDLRGALAAAHAAGAAKIVLDLRGDPGGLLDEAVGVASQFLGSGNVLIERDASGHDTYVAVRSGGAAVDTPLVVLVDGGTASAAEIVAGALQDHRRALVIGTTTFGTGTVLSTYVLADGSAVLLATAEWLTPDGHQIWHKGITPDQQVALASGAAPLSPEAAARLSPAQLAATSDLQLKQALADLTH